MPSSYQGFLSADHLAMALMTMRLVLVALGCASAVHAACAGRYYPITNENFYGYPNTPSFAPWTLTNVSGAGCEYYNSYRDCLGDGFGSSDPNCLYAFARALLENLCRVSHGAPAFRLL